MGLYSFLKNIIVHDKIFILFIYLSRGRDSRRLDEVVLHETLEVEVGELIAGLGLEKRAELGIGDDLTTILLILEVIGTDVRVDLLAHVGAGHLRADRLTKELGKLVADTSGLHEAGGLAVAGTLALLGRGLLGDLHLAVHRLLERLEIALEGGEDTERLLKLGAELSELRGNGRLGGGLGIGRGNNGGGHRLGGLDSVDLGGLHLLLRLLGLISLHGLHLLLGGRHNNILGNNGGSRKLITLRSTDHPSLYIR
jgi:hypothetical protein